MQVAKQPGLATCLAVQVARRQSIDEIVLIALEAVVHREIDDFELLRKVVAFHELLCIAMSGTEKQYIDFIQGQLLCKT